MGRTLIEGKAVQVPDVLADPEYMYLDHPKKPALEPFSAFRYCGKADPSGLCCWGVSQ
jgi:hypothetical protein